jgi:hypothetical protein
VSLPRELPLNWLATGSTSIGKNGKDKCETVLLLPPQNIPTRLPERLCQCPGGRMTMLAAALDSRIRLAAPSGVLNLLQERIGNQYSYGAQVIPGLLK